MKRIYLDHAAATPLDKRVKEAMEPFWSEIFANPGNEHKDGLLAKEHLEKSRETISQILGVRREEIFFTSGGTESNSLALIGFLNYLEDKGKLDGSHIITSVIEHPSVLDIFKKYKKKGLGVDFVPVTGDGLINMRELEQMINEDTVLVSIVYVNSEIGTVQPLKEISNLIKKKNPRVVFHTDASQAPLYLEIKVDGLGVDMMSMDGQKIYGPKGFVQK
jgi:cysteine desulfurase